LRARRDTIFVSIVGIAVVVVCIVITSKVVHDRGHVRHVDVNDTTLRSKMQA